MDVIIIAIAAITLLILLGVRKVIYLNLIRIIYGEFSFKYIMKFKKFTNKKPHAYCFKDDFYYHILAIKNAFSCKMLYKSNIVFSFDDFNFNKDFKQLILDKGQPDCFTMSSEKNIPLKVAGYKSRMFHSNEKTLYYFCNQNYLMGEYVFSSLADNTSKLIVETMKKEFKIDVKYSKNFTIVDPAGNYLYFTDTGFFLSIKYFNSKNKTVQSIMDFTNATEESKSDVQSTFGGLSC